MKFNFASDSPLLKPSFLFGAATASFQIEGGRASRRACIWDTFCATPGAIRDGSNGDVACDHLQRWQDDVQLLAELKVDAYRLSISWPRVMLPSGELDGDGVQFYIDLLDTLKARGIQTFVTLYHWDLPQWLEDQGGWVNRQTAYEFARYADLITNALGNRVDAYATFNEPFCSSYLGYEIGIHAPGKKSQAMGRQAAHHILLAHGLALPLMRANVPAAKHGIVLNFTPAYPASADAADMRAAELANNYFNLWYIEPLFNRRYPDVGDYLPSDAMPVIEEGDFAIISRPIDYLGVNFYTRTVYRADSSGFAVVDQVNAPKTDIGWEIYPDAFRALLVDLHTRYPLPPIYITENGAAMADKVSLDARGLPQVADTDRVAYYQAHLEALQAAMAQGVVVHGYFAWSLMDNFEWAEGYLKRFGIVYVDYQTQQRIKKFSALAFQALQRQRRGD